MQTVTVVTRERTRDGEERPLEYIELWLAVGGAEALISNEISTAAVAACLHHESPAVGLVDLFALIGQSAEEEE
ncbi:MAG: hypothetical protein KF817_04725 [Phycisphaeraceae bacterium]|nr:hypothetical protein [Phycisphaeraceae bacterium]